MWSAFSLKILHGPDSLSGSSALKGTVPKTTGPFHFSKECSDLSLCFTEQWSSMSHKMIRKGKPSCDILYPTIPCGCKGFWDLGHRRKELGDFSVLYGGRWMSYCKRLIGKGLMYCKVLNIRLTTRICERKSFKAQMHLTNASYRKSQSGGMFRARETGQSLNQDEPQTLGMSVSCFDCSHYTHKDPCLCKSV